MTGKIFVGLFALVLSFILSACGGTFGQQKGGGIDVNQPKLDDGLELQSANNQTACHNTLRPSGTALDATAASKLSFKSATLQTLKSYMELRRGDHSALSSVAGTISIVNGGASYTATVDCAASGEPNQFRTGQGTAPAVLIPQGDDIGIASNVNYIFTIVGSSFPSAHPAPSVQVSNQPGDMTTWMTQITSSGKVDFFTDASDSVQIIYSSRDAANADGTYWFRFALARFQLQR